MNDAGLIQMHGKDNRIARYIGGSCKLTRVQGGKQDRIHEARRRDV